MTRIINVQWVMGKSGIEVGEMGEMVGEKDRNIMLKT